MYKLSEWLLNSRLRSPVNATTNGVNTQTFARKSNPPLPHYLLCSASSSETEPIELSPKPAPIFLPAKQRKMEAIHRRAGDETFKSIDSLLFTRRPKRRRPLGATERKDQLEATFLQPPKEVPAKLVERTQQYVCLLPQPVRVQPSFPLVN